MKRDVLRVDFSVVGFPKCGTTALIEILAASPALYVSSMRRKEAARLAEAGHVPPDPSKPHGNKFAHQVNTRFAKHMLAKNPDTLFLISVRPAGEALLSWYDMHRMIARDPKRVTHFVVATPESRAFYSSCSVQQYYETYARDRQKFADDLRGFLDVSLDLNYLIVTQARLSRDARGVARTIHDRLGARADDAYYDGLPAGHTPTGKRNPAERVDSAAMLAELEANDRQLFALLAELDPARVLRTGADGF